MILTCRPIAVTKFLCGVAVGLGFDGGGWECRLYTNGSCLRARMIDLRCLPTPDTHVSKGSRRGAPGNDPTVEVTP